MFASNAKTDSKSAPPYLSAFKEPIWLEFRDLSSINITGPGTGMLDGIWPGRSWEKLPMRVMVVVILEDIAKITLLSQSTKINITSSTIGVGDDCISIGPSSNNISISKITCGLGHGISVGSLGKYPSEQDVNGVYVKNCTLIGIDNGVRVKSWPGSPPSKASNLKFEDIIMTNVKNPIIIDQEYCPGKGCEIKPSQVKISDVLFKNIKGSATTKSKVTLVCKSSMSCENVVLTNIDLKYILNCLMVLKLQVVPT
ncbi:hypothetical protein IFM89_006534 [Coptis chinensis]|uniref:Polygalacturonase n=1 Tax=Coptis chinensis TaxID=261450 RepID=A0A835IMQ0_9MAGN|nr:hypothetical protein IFM89_006534 [Coptis chinensis]